MGILNWAEKRSNALTMWDVGLLKVTAVLFGIIVGAHVPSFVIGHVWWFAAAVLVLGGGFAYRWFTGATGD